ncbi:recombinase family protein [Actinoplanes sp. NPDC051470]|uniref:recombinase family protein n=1 Tax=Actinoplanes sp. NPDC051470 TaxID=3157224 RepID=UPI00342B7409
MKLLGAVRLSRHRGDADPSTSPERQTASIEHAAKYHGSTIIGWATDLDVSADKMNPFQRPELGAWLRSRVDEFDGIVWSRFDRAVRNMMHMHDLTKWAMEHRKVLVFASGPGGDSMMLDLRGGALDPITQLIVMIFAFAAQTELTSIKDRNRDTKAFMRSTGRWGGGMHPFHATPERDGVGWRLIKNPDTWPVMREIVDRALNRESKRSIADDLNARGIASPREYRLLMGEKVPTASVAGVVTELGEKTLTIRPAEGDPLAVTKFPKHTKWAVADGDVVSEGQRLTKPILWSGKIIGDQLRAQALLGVVEFEKKAVLGADGMPIGRCPAMVTRDEWTQLQAILAAGAEGHAGKSHAADSSQLLGIAFCPHCGERMYYRKPRNRVNAAYTYEYYGCRSAWGYLAEQTKDTRCTAVSIPAADVEAAVESALLQLIGDVPVMKEVVHAGQSSSEDLATATAALTDLLMESAGKPAAVKAVYQKQITALEERITRLSELPETVAGTELVPTGKTYRQAWEAEDRPGRRRLLLDSGIRVETTKAAGGSIPSAFFDAANRDDGSDLLPVRSLHVSGDAAVMVEFPRDLVARTGGADRTRLELTQRSLFGESVVPAP